VQDLLAGLYSQSLGNSSDKPNTHHPGLEDSQKNLTATDITYGQNTTLCLQPG